MKWSEFKKLPRRQVYDTMMRMDKYLKQMQGSLDAGDIEIKRLNDVINNMPLTVNQPWKTEPNGSGCDDDPNCGG